MLSKKQTIFLTLGIAAFFVAALVLIFTQRASNSPEPSDSNGTTTTAATTTTTTTTSTTTTTTTLKPFPFRELPSTTASSSDIGNDNKDTINIDLKPESRPAEKKGDFSVPLGDFIYNFQQMLGTKSKGSDNSSTTEKPTRAMSPPRHLKLLHFFNNFLVHADKNVFDTEDIYHHFNKTCPGPTYRQNSTGTACIPMMHRFFAMWNLLSLNGTLENVTFENFTNFFGNGVEGPTQGEVKDRVNEFFQLLIEIMDRSESTESEPETVLSLEDYVEFCMAHGFDKNETSEIFQELVKDQPEKLYGQRFIKLATNYFYSDDTSLLANSLFCSRLFKD